MPDFTYEAMATTGQRTQGTLTAGSEREVLSMLDARGLFPIKVSAAKVSQVGGFRFGTGIKSKQKTAFYSQLADLLHSGVPLLRSLEILEKQSASPALGEVLREVRAAVADGTSLSEAMSRHPRAFNELAVSMVRAGQEGGFLEDVLRRIADFNEAQEDLQARVIGALAYPVFLSSVGFLVLNALVIFIVPIFEKSLFKSLRDRGELPVLTTFLLEFSHFMQGHFPSLIALVVALFVPRIMGMRSKPGAGGGTEPLTIAMIQVGVVMVGGIISTMISGLQPVALAIELVAALAIAGLGYAGSTTAGRMTFDGWKLRIPAAGSIYQNFALARFTRLMGTLLKNGIPILQSLRIAKDSTGNRVLVDALEKSAENITGGESLAAPLRACHYFPRDVVEMIAVAEESNTLDRVLVSISESLEKRTMRQLDLFVRLLEPIMLLVMGGFVGVILAGLLIPIFKANSAIGGG